MKVGSHFLQIFFILILCGLLEIVAGRNLGSMDSLFMSLPGLIIMVPPLLGLRGNLSGSFASRLGSGVHLGVIDFDNRDQTWREIYENLKAGLILTFLLPMVIAVFAHLVCMATGLGSIGMVKLISIAISTSLCSWILLTMVTIAVTWFFTKRGVDPDNVTTPIVATIGDFVTTGFLFLFTMVIA